MARPPSHDRAGSMATDNGACGAPAGSGAGAPAGVGRGGRDASANQAEFPRPFGDSAREPRRFAMAPIPLDMGTRWAVCKNGHALECAVLEGEELGEPCPECGAGVMTGCPRCGLGFAMGAGRAEAGPACPRCGEPLPWSPEARRARRAAALKILGAAAAAATIIASLFYVGTLLG